MTRKRLFLFIAATLLLTLLCVSVASAAYEPLKVSMELSTYKFTEPRNIKVSISVANVGEGDMPGPVTLYYPNNKQITEFGSPTLGVGVSKSWSGTWKVTQKQLDAGKITFKIKYSVYNDNGELVNKTKTFSRAITYTGGEAGIEVNRTVAPSVADKGQEVTVTYDVTNTGTVDLTGVTIKENASISSTTAKLNTIKAGEKASHTFKTKMKTKDLTSQGVVSYKVNGKANTTKVEAKTVKYGKVDVTASLSTDKKGGAPGETVAVKLTVKNNGTEDLTDITVTDPVLGTVFSGETIPAGKTVELEKDVTVTENQDLQFTVAGNNGDSGELETTTGRVSIVATDPAEQIILDVTAEADRDTVYELPGTVRFTVTVTNNSNVDVLGVDVTATGVKLYTFPLIEAGQSRTFSRDINVSMAGQYQFVATCTDALDQKVNFSSNILHVGYAVPTQAPTPTPAITAEPLVLPPEPVQATMDPAYLQLQETTGWLKWIFLGLGLLLLTLVLIGVIRRGQQKRESDAAMDHLERGSVRDYTAPASKEKKKAGKDQPEDVPSQDMQMEEYSDGYAEEGQDPELMAETLRRLYEEGPDRGEAQVTVEEGYPEEGYQDIYVPDQDAYDQGYAPEVYPEMTEPQPENVAAETQGRRRRSGKH